MPLRAARMCADSDDAPLAVSQDPPLVSREVTLAQVAFPPPLSRPGARVEHIRVRETSTVVQAVVHQLSLPQVTAGLPIFTPITRTGLLFLAIFALP